MRLLFSISLLLAPLAGAQGPSDPGADRAARPDRKFTLAGLLRSLKDPDEEVRAKAAEDLGKVRPPAVEAVPELIEALQDPSSSVRYRAAETLEKLGTPKARKAVMKYRRRLGRQKGW